VVVTATGVRVAIRARWFSSGIYVRKADLLEWFDREAAALRNIHRDEVAAHVESMAADLRKVRA
jgi:hypothetical protein